MALKRRSSIARMQNYYRVFRAHLSPTKSLYFALRLTF